MVDPSIPYFSHLPHLVMLYLHIKTHVLLTSIYDIPLHSIQFAMQRSTELKMSLKEDLGKAAVAAAFGLAVAAGPAQAITKSELNQLSYLQVKGTGLANRCPRSSVRTPSPPSPARSSPRCASSPRLGPSRRRSARAARPRRSSLTPRS